MAGAFCSTLVCCIHIPIMFAIINGVPLAGPHIPQLPLFPTAFLNSNVPYAYTHFQPTTSTQQILTQLAPSPYTNRASAPARSQTIIPTPMTAKSLSLPPQSSFEGINGCQLIKRIGKGTYGEVYHVRMQNQEGALKVFRSGPSNKFECETERCILREIALFEHQNNKKLQTSHLLLGIQAIECPNLMMEYIKGYDLTKINRIGFTFSTFIDFMLSMMKQIESTLNELHSVNLYHNDIKPGNIIYNPDQKLFSLIDFGLAVPLSLSGHWQFRKMNFWTTLPFMSPFHLEIIENIKLRGSMVNDENTRKKARFADFYSLAITAVTIVSNNCFENEALCLMAKRIERRQRLFVSRDAAGFTKWSVFEAKSKMMPYWRTVQDAVYEEYRKSHSNWQETEFISLLANWVLLKPSYFENVFNVKR